MARWRLLGLVAAALLVVVGCQEEEPDPRLAEARVRLEQTETELAEARRRLAGIQRDLEAERKLSGRLQDRLSSLSTAADHAGGGSVVTLPLLGELRWGCNNQRRFAFAFHPAGATVGVEHSIEGEVTRETANPGDEVKGSYEAPSTHQEWKITYRHKPGAISALVVPMPAVHQGACYIRNYVVEQTRAPSG